MNLQKVSIVIVNYNGRHHLSECFNSISKLHYPQDKIEVIVVDNGSCDGSVELMQQKFSWVKLIRNSKNEGFAKPCNDGARAATGEYVAFINNDMRVQKDWLIELLSSMQNSGAKCAGSVILNWNGDYLDFGGGGISFQGYGFQDDFKRPMREMESLLNTDKEILFACGGSMIVEKELFLFAGGFDEDYFAYYEDVDLGWRLRVLGCKIVLSVKSRVYHKHNSTSKTITKERIQYLFERNKLYTCYKNYGEELFYKVFFPSLLLEIRETYLESEIDGYNYNIKNAGAFDSEPVTIGSKAAMKLSALNEFVENIQRTEKKRAFIQSNRKTSDDEIKKLLTNPFIIFLKDSAEFLSSEYDIVKTFKLDKILNSELKCKVMLISNDVVGENMTENGTRYWEIAKALAATDKFDVTLGCQDSCNLSQKGINVLTYTISNPESLLKPALEAKVILIKGSLLEDIPKLKNIVDKKYVILDGCETSLIDNMEQLKGDDLAVKNYYHKETAEALNYQLNLGDFFICANEKQRDYWLGMLSERGKITPSLYESDPSCRKLINIVPFGISDTPPVQTKKLLKGVVPGIKAEDKVLIWGVGIDKSCDPFTIIKAVKLITEKRQDVKLFFMRENTQRSTSLQADILNKAVKLAHELDVYDKYVFFNLDSVNYSDRQNYLIEADIGVSCHFDTLETRFSKKTSLLDYLWANLPVVCTTGDNFANLVREKQLGSVVGYNEPQELAEVVLTLLNSDADYNKCRENANLVAKSLSWDKLTQPIIDFCEEPIRFTSRYETENQPALSLASNVYEGNLGQRVSLQERLSNIEKQQIEITQLIKADSRLIKETHGKSKDIQKWSNLMESRFTKLKSKLGRIKFLKRFVN